MWTLEQEHIDISAEGGWHKEEESEEATNPAPLIDLLDRSPQSTVVRASATNLRDIDRRGLLWLLDDEALMSGSSEDQLLDKFTAMFNEREFERMYVRTGSNQLTIHHCQGTNSVRYNLDNWLKAARENPTSRNASIVLIESQKYRRFLSADKPSRITCCINIQLLDKISILLLFLKYWCLIQFKRNWWLWG